jgi:(p)ppGpp synthase/HD superfamily hydrolase
VLAVDRSFSNVENGTYLVDRAICCMPIFGEDVLGELVESGRLLLHTANCIVVSSVYSQDYVKYQWDDNSSLRDSMVGIRVLCRDEVGMFHRVSKVIADYALSIHFADVVTSRLGDPEAVFRFELLVDDFGRYKDTIIALEKTTGVLNIKRNGNIVPY